MARRTETSVSRERLVWIAVVAVLSTSLAWLAAVNLVLLTGRLVGELPALLAAGRALLRVMVLVVRHGWPLAVLGLVGWTLAGLLAIALRPGPRVERGMHHA